MDKRRGRLTLESSANVDVEDFTSSRGMMHPCSGPSQETELAINVAPNEPSSPVGVPQRSIVQNTVEIVEDSVPEAYRGGPVQSPQALLPDNEDDLYNATPRKEVLNRARELSVSKKMTPKKTEPENKPRQSTGKLRPVRKAEPKPATALSLLAARRQLGAQGATEDQHSDGSDAVRHKGPTRNQNGIQPVSKGSLKRPARATESRSAKKDISLDFPESQDEDEEKRPTKKAKTVTKPPANSTKPAVKTNSANIGKSQQKADPPLLKEQENKKPTKKTKAVAKKPKSSIEPASNDAPKSSRKKREKLDDTVSKDDRDKDGSAKKTKTTVKPTTNGVEQTATNSASKNIDKEIQKDVDQPVTEDNRISNVRTRRMAQAEEAATNPDHQEEAKSAPIGSSQQPIILSDREEPSSPLTPLKYPSDPPVIELTTLQNPQRKDHSSHESPADRRVNGINDSLKPNRPTIISFSKSGPRNQGSSSVKKTTGRPPWHNRSSVGPVKDNGAPKSLSKARLDEKLRSRRSPTATSMMSFRSTRAAPNVATDVVDALAGFTKQNIPPTRREHVPAIANMSDGVQVAHSSDVDFAPVQPIIQHVPRAMDPEAQPRPDTVAAAQVTHSAAAKDGDSALFRLEKLAVFGSALLQLEKQQIPQLQLEKAAPSANISDDERAASLPAADDDGFALIDDFEGTTFVTQTTVPIDAAQILPEQEPVKQAGIAKVSHRELSQKERQQRAPVVPSMVVERKVSQVNKEPASKPHRKPSRAASHGSQKVDMHGSPVPEGFVVPPKSTVLETFTQNVMEDEAAVELRSSSSSIFAEQLKQLTKSRNQRSHTVPNLRSDRPDSEKTLVEPVRDRPFRAFARKRSLSSASSSDSSSETENTSVAQSDLNMWRNALKPHQMNLFDELVVISHRLVQHLVQRETAAANIVDEYRNRGLRVVEDMELSHAKQLRDLTEGLRGRKKRLRKELNDCGKKLKTCAAVFQEERREGSRGDSSAVEAEKQLQKAIEEYCT